MLPEPQPRSTLVARPPSHPIPTGHHPHALPPAPLLLLLAHGGCSSQMLPPRKRAQLHPSRFRPNPTQPEALTHHPKEGDRHPSRLCPLPAVRFPGSNALRAGSLSQVEAPGGQTSHPFNPPIPRSPEGPRRTAQRAHSRSTDSRTHTEAFPSLQTTRCYFCLVQMAKCFCDPTPLWRGCNTTSHVQHSGRRLKEENPPGRPSGWRCQEP